MYVYSPIHYCFSVAIKSTSQQRAVIQLFNDPANKILRPLQAILLVLYSHACISLNWQLCQAAHAQAKLFHTRVILDKSVFSVYSSIIANYYKVYYLFYELGKRETCSTSTRDALFSSVIVFRR